MENENTTQAEKQEVTRNEEVVGTQPTTTEKVENKKEVRTYSQEEVDSQMKRTRLATEKEAKKQVLAQLGLTLDDEDKLNAYKEAYQNSLSEEDRRQAEVAQLQNDKQELTSQLEEKEYVIKALTLLTGKKEEDVDKIVRMAKGLRTDTNTIEDAIKDVVSMVGTGEPEKEATKIVTQVSQDIPTSRELEQPSDKVVVDTSDNPFMPGSINLTKQCQLIKTNPELAKKYANEAGVKLTF